MIPEAPTLTEFFGVQYTGPALGASPDPPGSPRGRDKGDDMQVRLTRFAIVAMAIAVFAAGCGKYSISNIRSAKAFQDANSLYSKGDYAAAVPYYEASIKHNPELGYPYFFLGHSHEQLYKPTKKDDPANIKHLEDAARYYRQAVDRLKDAKDEKELQV